MEAVRTSETSVDNHFTRQYNPEDSSEQITKPPVWGGQGPYMDCKPLMNDGILPYHFYCNSLFINHSVIRLSLTWLVSLCKTK
jgi:hypothetical protein